MEIEMKKATIRIRKDWPSHKGEGFIDALSGALIIRR